MEPNTQSSRLSIWYDPQKRSIIYQVVILLMVGLLGYYLISNTTTNLQRQSIATGFGFLEKEASFEIGESLIPYSAADRYARALFVGVLNSTQLDAGWDNIYLRIRLARKMAASNWFARWWLEQNTKTTSSAGGSPASPRDSIRMWPRWH